MPPKLFSFTLLSKIAPVNHLVSHSCKNKGLKVPCFHTLTKNIRGAGSGSQLPGEKEGGSTGFSLCAAPNLPRFHESPITTHESLFLSPSTPALTNSVSA